MKISSVIYLMHYISSAGVNRCREFNPYCSWKLQFQRFQKQANSLQNICCEFRLRSQKRRRACSRVVGVILPAGILPSYSWSFIITNKVKSFGLRAATIRVYTYVFNFFSKERNILLFNRHTTYAFLLALNYKVFFTNGPGVSLYLLHEDTGHP